MRAPSITYRPSIGSSLDRTRLAGLTPRQREILQFVAEGNSSKQVAAKLDISVKTVEAHRGQIMERLGIQDVTGLVRFAIRVGLISPDA